MNILANELYRLSYEQVQPMEFYRDVFPEGSLDDWREVPSERTEHKYCAILLEVSNNPSKNKVKVKRHTVTDDLDVIDEAQYSENFCLMSPISYVGKTRDSGNARNLYALVVELDNLKVKQGVQIGLHSLIKQFTEDSSGKSILPRPTYLVASGTGLHLYYVFEKAIPLFPNVVKSFQKYKRTLTTKLWNKYVTTSYKKHEVQQESLFQGFRVVGTLTKKGDRVEAYRTGDKVTIEYMNQFVPVKDQIDVVYVSNLTLAEAKVKYPDWYERRIVNGEPKKNWVCNEAVYEWWKERILTEAVVGHRYYCLMMLVIYAIKCDISYERVEADCFEVMEHFEKMTVDEDNHFTVKDVMDALVCYQDKSLVTYPINSIANRSGLEIEKNKRNGRSQQKHIAMVNNMRKYKRDVLEEDEYKNNGRPRKDDVIKRYLKRHPDVTSPTKIAQACNVSRTTVYNYFKRQEDK